MRYYGLNFDLLPVKVLNSDLISKGETQSINPCPPPLYSTHLYEEMVLEYSLDWFEEVGGKRQGVPECGLLLSQSIRDTCTR